MTIFLEKFTHFEKMLLMFSIPLLLVLGLLNLLIFFDTRPEDEINITQDALEIEKINAINEYGILNMTSFAESVDECRWEVMACDQQFKDNKTLACGLGKSRLIDALLTRDDSPCKGREKEYVEKQAELACTKECPPSTPTPRPTLTPTPTNSPLPSPTPTPTATPEPTPTSIPENNTITIRLETTLPGIGNVPETNSSPLHQTRLTTVILSDPQGVLLETKETELVFDSSTGSYVGTFSTARPLTTQISAKVRFDTTLFKNSSTQIILDPTIATYTLPKIALISGDMDQNNSMDIQDYNIILSCLRNETLCTNDIRNKSDLNDNATLYADDFNILLRGFFTPQGDFRLSE